MDFMFWAVLLSEAAASSLSMAMIRRGYTVGPALSNGGRSTWEGEASVLLAQKLHHNSRDANQVLADIREALSNMGAMWHAVIVYAGTGATVWMPSNIKLPHIPTPTTPAPPDPDNTPTRFDLMDKP